MLELLVHIVLLHERQALAIDVKMRADEGNEVDMKKLEKDDINEEIKMEKGKEFVEQEVAVDVEDIVDNDDDDIEEAAAVGFDEE